jgi:hypothetical protein
MAWCRSQAIAAVPWDCGPPRSGGAPKSRSAGAARYPLAVARQSNRRIQKAPDSSDGGLSIRCSPSRGHVVRANIAGARHGVAGGEHQFE